jgi:arylformamidase
MSGGARTGPRVWLQMDQAELDAAYDQAVWAANRDQVLKRNVASSDVARARLGAPERHAYGATPIEALDVYRPAHADAPINVYVHGGQWRQRHARDYAYLAEPLVRAGALVVIPDFAGVEVVGGDLSVVADQVRRAVAWVFANAARLGGDPDRLHVSGHSSGGHLAGVLLTTDWVKDFGLPADLVKGGLCCSGMYDLQPVRLSARSAFVTLTDESEHALSPQRHLERLTAPVIVAWGTQESPEFQRQGRDFAAALEAAGKPMQRLVADGYNHFEIIETLANPYGLLGHAMVQQMKLT